MDDALKKIFSSLSPPEVSDRLMPGRIFYDRIPRRENQLQLLHHGATDGRICYTRYSILTEPLPTAMTFVV
jgi:hypothetical protein